MADFSDDSDVHPSEMARMVEDLDDLDNTLLGSSTKKEEPFSAANRDKGNTEMKKKVAFKDFDNDDPLADLLSDDETSYNMKKPIVANAKSNLVADLFGIKSAKSDETFPEPIKPKINPPEVRKIEDTRENVLPRENLTILTNTKTSSATASQERAVSRDKIRSSDEITSRTEDSKKMPNSKTRKSSLMEDLFGTRTRSASTKENDFPPSFSKTNVQNSPNLVLPDPPKSEKSPKSSFGYVMDSGTTREPRRGRRNSPVISDPLGLFSVPKPAESVVEQVPENSEKVEAKVESRPDNALPREDLPEWLGGTAKTKEIKLAIEKEPESDKKSCEDPPTKNTTDEERSDFSWQKNDGRKNFYPDMSTMFGTQFDQQSAIISMQQQEHELKTAATLSHQNEQVAKIVEHQKAKLEEQGKMFNVLMKHQMDRQSMLETQMKIQQARIDHYMQTLMSQPTGLPAGVFPDEKGDNETNETDEKSQRPENLVKKLELENGCLENTIEVLKEKHDEEITILRESYEKQMLFLRQGMEKLEQKMYQDFESMDKEWEKKVDRLKREKAEIEETYKEEITRLKKDEKILIEEIYNRHSHNVELLQREHAETIDEISRAKEIERQAVDSINNHKTDLDDFFKNSQIVIESFQNLEKKLEARDEEYGETRENYVKKQEEHLQLLRDQLNLQQESLVLERKRLMEVSERLNADTAALTAEFKKNSSMVNETQERLATRERSLIREKQLFDEQMKWEREHLQVIKDAWTKEQERQMKLIFDEREYVANERAKIGVYNSLRTSSDEMLKVELEAALKAAQEATNEANREKYQWQEQARGLDAEKRLLREKEKHLIDRAKELERLTQSALAKRNEGLEALEEAKRIEQRHKENLEQLQIQLENLAQRDQKRRVAEKITQARNRLATKIYPAEKPESEMAERVSPILRVNERSLTSTSHVSTHFKDIVDPHLLLLKLNLDNKLDTTDELLADAQLISQ